ncbi:MAG: deoxyribodipyrimidine photo-lyase, partial [Candidatus Saccharibacteria bacterium]
MQTNSSSRIKELNNSNNLPGKCVLYVMSRDQRVQDNHALFYAQQSAIKNNLPVVVFFNLLNSTGERTREHYEFMISGLKQVMEELAELKITFILKTGGYLDNLVNVEKEINPSEIYFDFSPLDGPRKVV